MTLSAGFSKVCEARSGGVLTIWLANIDDITTMTLTALEYSAITMVTGAVFFVFEFEQDSAEMRETVAMENGSAAVTHEVEFFLPKLSTVQRNAITEVIEASICGMCAIVEDANSNQWVLGYNEIALLKRPLRLTSDSSSSGKNPTDLTGSTLVLGSVDGEKARIFTGTVAV